MPDYERAVVFSLVLLSRDGVNEEVERHGETHDSLVCDRTCIGGL